MGLLLDTHILLWLMDSDSRLSVDARNLIIAATKVYVSSASIWEVAIKSNIGKLDANVERLVALVAQAGLLELPVTFKHAMAGAKLALHHRDPFDRLLIAQAIGEQIQFLTADSHLRLYSELVQCV